MAEALRGYAARVRVAWAPRGAIRVFRYHGVIERVTDPLLERQFTTLPLFRAQMRLFRMAPVLSLEELDAVVSGRARAPAGAAAITFDGGYRNSLTAFELLERVKKPAALFVAAGPVSRQALVWTVEAALLLLHGAAARVELPGESFPLTTRADRERALARVRTILEGLSAGERREALQALREQYPPGEWERLLAAFPAFRMMTWEEVRQIGGRGFAIGSAGVEREAQHAGQDAAVRRAELWLSKLRIERETARPCRYFAYPPGGRHPDSREEAERAGYSLAFSSNPAPVTTKADRYMLPRLPGGESLRTLISDYIWPARGRREARLAAAGAGE